MKFEAKQIPEGINTTKEHPLKELGILLAGIVGILIVTSTVLIMASDYLLGFVPIEVEEKWFTQSQLEILNSKAPNTQVKAVENYLTQLVEKLKPEQENSPRFTIQLTSDDSPNAFITPGGHIFVTTGLLRHVNSENALSMVLAHEMAHQYHRHPVRGLGRGIVVAMSLMVVAGVDGSSWVSDIAANSISLGLLAFSRKQEREADEVGIQLLAAHYGHTGGATEFFKQLVQNKDSTQSGFSEYLSTHPATTDRIEFLSSYPSKKITDLIQLPSEVISLRESLPSTQE